MGAQFPTSRAYHALSTPPGGAPPRATTAASAVPNSPQNTGAREHEKRTRPVLQLPNGEHLLKFCLSEEELFLRIEHDVMVVRNTSRSALPCCESLARAMNYRRILGVCTRVSTLVTLICIWNLPRVTGQAHYDESGPNAPIHLSVLEGESTSLPCPIDTATREPIAAVWYHVATRVYQQYGGSPYTSNGHLQAKRAYAIEAPDRSTSTAAGGTTGLVDGTHWKQPLWSGRAFFSLLSDPPALRLNRLQRSDSGSYVCNVTYRDNVTSAGLALTESRVDLFVAAQACPPSIKNARGATVKETAGPYAEGDTIRLTCEIETLHQLRRNVSRLIASKLRSSRGTMATSDGGWKNVATLGPLTRRDLLSNVTCLATSNVSLPGVATVLLDLYLAPTTVTIWSWPAQQTDDPSGLVESSSAATQHSPPPNIVTMTTTSGPGLALADREAVLFEAMGAIRFGSPSGFSKPASFECEVTGSRPAANVTWFLDGNAVEPAFSRSVTAGNVTTSMLLLPASAQSGRLLECRAVNGNLPESRGVLSRFLNVDMSRKTEVSIRLGAGLNASHIVEGADVYMECSVLAASKVVDVTWRHEGTPVKELTGDDGPVSPLELRVRYAPRCGVHQYKVLAARPNEQLNVTCDVTADPGEELQFFWIAEDAAGKRRQLTRTQGAGTQYAWLEEGTPELQRSNQLEVVVDAHLFHATLLCWARNAVGTQREPCRNRFQLRRDRESSLDCTVGNYTDTSFSIACFSRRHGRALSGEAHGVKATKTRLRIELFDATAGNRSVRGFWVTSAETSGDPLLLTGLRPATDYLVLARLETESNTFVTYVRTLAPAQSLRKHIASTENTAVPPPRDTTVLVIVCVAVAATLGLAAAIGAVLWFKYHRRRSRLLNATVSLKRAEHKAYLASDASCS
ncbi:hypothetical protein MRX96_040362 [Rhipicephalus microplus]